jgi:hypothetical protein
VIDAAWQLGKADREALDAKLMAEAYKGNGAATNSQGSDAAAKDSEESTDEVGGVMSFARFMARYVPFRHVILRRQTLSHFNNGIAVPLKRCHQDDRCRRQDDRRQRWLGTFAESARSSSALAGRRTSGGANVIVLSQAVHPRYQSRHSPGSR